VLPLAVVVSKRDAKNYRKAVQGPLLFMNYIAVQVDESQLRIPFLSRFGS
jgi:hypothetical protein